MVVGGRAMDVDTQARRTAEMDSPQMNGMKQAGRALHALVAASSELPRLSAF